MRRLFPDPHELYGISEPDLSWILYIISNRRASLDSALQNWIYSEQRKKMKEKGYDFVDVIGKFWKGEDVMILRQKWKREALRYIRYLNKINMYEPKTLERHIAHKNIVQVLIVA